MKELKYILLALILFPLMGMVSACSSDDSEEDEFANWQQRNNAVVNQWSNNSALRKIKSYTKDQTTGGTSNDYIYVEVLEEGAGTESPLFTDSVWVAYRRLQLADGRQGTILRRFPGKRFHHGTDADASWRSLARAYPLPLGIWCHVKFFHPWLQQPDLRHCAARFLAPRRNKTGV